jgi:hypothetical protein
MVLLSIAGFLHAVATPKSKGFATPEPTQSAEKPLVKA